MSATDTVRSSATVHEDRTVLEAADLHVKYYGAPTEAVTGVDFRLTRGSCIAFVGETGSGKTTSVLAATRLLEGAAITAERLAFGGQNLLGMPGKELRELRRRSIGMVFQDPTASWNPTRAISSQLLGTTPRKERPEMREKLLTLCDRVGIKNAAAKIDSHPYQLSGGQLQRFMIAGALLHDPVLLVADEPTSALDTSVQAELIDLLDELRRERDLGVLLVSHDLGVVARMAGEVIVLFRGDVVEQGTVAQVVGAPEHPYTRSLLASSLGMTGPRKTRLRTDAGWSPEATVEATS
ncbi:ABC transporter ATP-binding protein [Amnibacterium flavum]|uniref:Dipeptide ABC transporter ATP-binding protein DppD n=1 Tax=Amnibacterium flavum TaxID=2173173 RepID=A0A2V1HZD8_9MICO|nr:ABC transporter ATP-binding protein [Amnibacterium flavum]PVZ96084.1 dipeptide ABC transporter ATP-binding protein DppD [Amnibacterium flavum]